MEAEGVDERSALAATHWNGAEPRGPFARDRAGGTSAAKARAGRGVYIKPMGREETFEDVSWRGRIAGAGDSSRR